jgi:hypothetical protein
MVSFQCTAKQNQCISSFSQKLKFWESLYRNFILKFDISARHRGAARQVFGAALLRRAAFHPA